MAKRSTPTPLFADRAAAGRLLAAKLQKRAFEAPVIYALPRGGVAVAVEIAELLHAPLDLLLVRKIGVPGFEELAAGCIVDGERPDIIFNEDIANAAHLSREQVETAGMRQLGEIERRRALYLPGRAPIPAKDRTAILVDDGVATGASMKAAITATRRRAPRRVVIAVPVAAATTATELAKLADEVICLTSPSRFGSVGYYYHDFHQLDDNEVVALLLESEYGNEAQKRRSATR
jgi:putative phosphoribosyl transferase